MCINMIQVHLNKEQNEATYFNIPNFTRNALLQDKMHKIFIYLKLIAHMYFFKTIWFAVQNT